MTSAPFLLAAMLDARLAPDSLAFLEAARRELAQGAGPHRLAQLLALCSRHLRAGTPLAPDAHAAARARQAGFDPARWSTLDAARVALLLAFPAPAPRDTAAAFEACLRFADHGELCALYRALPLLPHGEHLAAHAAEGCRSNMRTVFEAVACDSPYPVRCFDEVAWRQLVIKAVFIDAPLWRVHGLDTRLSSQLARMALDLADERRSAGRPVPPQLWLCLGVHGGERGARALQAELDGGGAAARTAALLALARAGAAQRALAWLDTRPSPHPSLAACLQDGDFTQAAFGRLSQPATGAAS